MMDNEWWIDFVAGWVSGAVSVVACQPLDTILTRLQAGGNVLVVVQPVQAAGVQAAGVQAAGVTSATVTTGGGTAAATSLSISTATITGRTLISNFGIRSLWKGSSPMIGAVPFQNALLMGGYGFGKRYADNSNSNNNSNNDNSNNSNTLIPVFIGGCIGGILQSFLMSPIEWIKVNQQTSITAIGTGSNNTAGMTVMKQFLNNKSNLWNRGLTATLLRDGIPHGCWFATYEYCKTIMSSSSLSEIDGYEASSNKNDFSSDSSSSSSSSSSSFYKTVTVPVVSGAFAATAAWTVGYPFDIIKTRIQANNNNTTTNTNTTTVKGVYETGLILIKESNGNIMRGLYRGFTLKLIRSIPASMIGFFTYEYVASSI